MKIIVIGAGVVGMATAYVLMRDGHQVTVVDRQEGAGLECSFANGGQLSYSYVAPLAGPGVFASLPGYLLRRDSPLRLSPQLDFRQWRWCLEFLGACTRSRSNLTTERLLRLAFLSRDQLNQMMAYEPELAFSHLRNGKLVVYSSPSEFKGAREQMDYQRRLGSEQETLDVTACTKLEPALETIRSRLVGGIYTPGEEAGDCGLFCRSMTNILSGAVEMRFGVETTRLLVRSRQVVGLDTSAGVMEADAYVLASGVGSRSLARTAGFDLPLYPLKGYSISVPAAHAAPKVSITDYSRKIVYAPIGDTLRCAGMADIVGWSRDIDKGRLSTLVREAKAAFPGASTDWSQTNPWAGLRPATPSGTPILGVSPVGKLFLNLGQGALGFTLAMGSARLVADAIANLKPSIPSDGFTITV